MQKKRGGRTEGDAPLRHINLTLKQKYTTSRSEQHFRLLGVGRHSLQKRAVCVRGQRVIQRVSGWAAHGLDSESEAEISSGQVSKNGTVH